jgi:hypothetical protein
VAKDDHPLRRVKDMAGTARARSPYARSTTSALEEMGITTGMRLRRSSALLSLSSTWKACPASLGSPAEIALDLWSVFLVFSDCSCPKR